MNITRRTLLGQTAAGAAAAGLPMPALAQARQKVRVGYLHTLAVDGHLWLADHLGTFGKEGLDPQWIQFNTGLELFQAMIGGSLDLLTTGAALSNFPARGQGKVFLINDVEYATAQLWVQADKGINSFADLKGKRISTTTGTTAHVFLDLALRKNGLKPDDVEIINQRMPDAVTSFISGAVGAVALWVPFNLAVAQKTPGAKMLTDASAFYPEAAIVGGWVARDDIYASDKALLQKVIRAWLPANEFLVSKPEEALEIIRSGHYSNIPAAEFKTQFDAQKVFGRDAWRTYYADGTVAKWLNQVTDFFIRTGNIRSPVKAEQYFDPKLFLDVATA